MPNHTAHDLTPEEMNARGLEAMTGMDFRMACEWFECGAAAGHANAALSAAGMYESAMGVSRDAQKVERYYRQAACGGMKGAEAKLQSLYWRRLAAAIAGFIISGIVYSALAFIAPQNEVSFGVSSFAALFVFLYVIASLNYAARLLFFDWFLDRGAAKLRLLQSPIARAVRKNLVRYNRISEATSVAFFAAIALAGPFVCLQEFEPTHNPSNIAWAQSLTNDLGITLTAPEILSLAVLLASALSAAVLWRASKVYPLMIGAEATAILILIVASSKADWAYTHIEIKALAGVSLAALLVCACRLGLRRIAKWKLRDTSLQLAP